MEYSKWNGFLAVLKLRRCVKRSGSAVELKKLDISCLSSTVLSFKVIVLSSETLNTKRTRQRYLGA